MLLKSSSSVAARMLSPWRRTRLACDLLDLLETSFIDSFRFSFLATFDRPLASKVSWTRADTSVTSDDVGVGGERALVQAGRQAGRGIHPSSIKYGVMVEPVSYNSKSTKTEKPAPPPEP